MKKNTDYGLLMEKFNLNNGAFSYKIIGAVVGTYNASTEIFVDKHMQEFQIIDSEKFALSKETLCIGYVTNFDTLVATYPEFITEEQVLANYVCEMLKMVYIGVHNIEDHLIDIKSINLSHLNPLSEMITQNNPKKTVHMHQYEDGEIGYLIPDCELSELLEKQDNELTNKRLKEMKQLVEEAKTKMIMHSESQSIGHPEKEIIDQQTKKNVDNNIIEEKVLNVRELYNILGERIIGQSEAIGDIVSAIALDPYSKKVNERTRCLLVGPPGCGKSEIIRTLSEYLDKPFVHVDSTQLTVQGYIGGNIEDSLSRLLIKANGNIEKAENGILVFDEIDKKGSSNVENASGIDVLYMILSFLDGTDYLVKYGSKIVNFNTSRLTIFAAGAFTEVLKQKSKLQKGPMGFTNKSINIVNERVELDPIDFVKFGFIPDEFIGRFQVISQLDPMTLDVLEKILRTSTTSPLMAEVVKLKNIDIDLSYEDEYIYAVAKKALELKTGARSLKSIIEKSIKNARLEALLNPGVYSSIKLLEKTVEDNKVYKINKRRIRNE